MTTFSIAELLERYNIKSRPTLYSRLNGLNIELRKKGNKSFASEDQVRLLDAQHEHIKKGGSLATFTPLESPEVTVVDSITQDSPSSDIAKVSETIQDDTQQAEILTALLSALSYNRPVLSSFEELENAINNDWLLTTSHVCNLIGVKPKGESFIRGSFLFIREGKIGRESAWKVRKRDQS